MTAVPHYTDAGTAQEVISVGAAGLAQIAPDAAVLSALRQAYAVAVRDPLILALALAALAFPFACVMDRLNIKDIAQERSHDGNNGTDVKAKHNEPLESLSDMGVAKDAKFEVKE